MKESRYIAIFALLLCAPCGEVWAAEETPNNGTDPTRLTTSASLVYEYNDLLPDLSRHAPRLDLILPFGQKQDYSVRLRVPVVRNDVLGNSDYGIGDVSLQGTHVFGLSRKGGTVIQAEWIFDSADRPELGTGKQVVKGTMIFARFLEKGIFAPAVVHSASVAGDDRRPTVNFTTIDLYYVPKLSNPLYFITLDPSLNSDWENDKQFAGLAVQVGRTMGRAFGGSYQLFTKPTVYVGSERPGDWSIELGIKFLGF